MMKNQVDTGKLADRLPSIFGILQSGSGRNGILIKSDPVVEAVSNL